MEDDLKIFDNPEFGELRISIINDEPWFVGKDVASALGYSLPQKAILTHVSDSDKKKMQLSDLQDRSKMEQSCKSGNYENNLSPHMKGSKVVLINESGLYSLVLLSKLPSAQKFKQWVTSEVLPSIRKTGSYSIKKREFPRAFYREDIGTLHADYFNEKEIFFFSEDLLDILHVESALMRKCLVNKFGSGSYVRMVSESGKVYLDERGTFALLMDEDPHRGYQIIFWLLTEVIPVLDGKPVAEERQLVVGKEKISYLKSLVSLMADVCKIADPALRCAMAEKIMALNHPDTSIN